MKSCTQVHVIDRTDPGLIPVCTGGLAPAQVSPLGALPGPTCLVPWSGAPGDKQAPTPVPTITSSLRGSETRLLPDLGMPPGPPSAAAPPTPGFPSLCQVPPVGHLERQPRALHLPQLHREQRRPPSTCLSWHQGTKACSNLPWATRCPARHLLSAKVKPLCQPGARGELGLRPHNLGHFTRAFTASNSSPVSLYRRVPAPHLSREGAGDKPACLWRPTSCHLGGSAGLKMAQPESRLTPALGSLANTATADQDAGQSHGS